MWSTQPIHPNLWLANWGNFFLIQTFGQLLGLVPNFKWWMSIRRNLQGLSDQPVVCMHLFSFCYAAIHRRFACFLRFWNKKLGAVTEKRVLLYPYTRVSELMGRMSSKKAWLFQSEYQRERASSGSEIGNCVFEWIQWDYDIKRYTNKQMLLHTL